MRYVLSRAKRDLAIMPGNYISMQNCTERVFHYINNTVTFGIIIRRT